MQTSKTGSTFQDKDQSTFQGKLDQATSLFLVRFFAQVKILSSPLLAEIIDYPNNARNI
jgi:hypothetical protein